MRYIKKPKYNTGGQIGSALGSTATSFIPGVGPLLAPIGGMIGGMIGKSLYKDKQPEMPKNIAYGNMGYKYGGKVQPMGNGAKKYLGPKHEDGGILIDEQGNPVNQQEAIAEVEGGETEQGGYIFSDTLIVPDTDMTFADAHEMLIAEGAPQEEIEQLAMMQEQMNGGSTTDMMSAEQPMEMMKDGGVVKVQSGEKMLINDSPTMFSKDYQSGTRQINFNVNGAPTDTSYMYKRGLGNEAESFYYNTGDKAIDYQNTLKPNASFNTMSPDSINMFRNRINTLARVKDFKDGGIYIKPEKRGTFKAQATRMGMGVQEAANKILSAPEGKYSPAMRKKANFARNFAKEYCGNLPKYVNGGGPKGLQELRGRINQNALRNIYSQPNIPPTVQPSSPSMFSKAGRFLSKGLSRVATPLAIGYGIGSLIGNAVTTPKNNTFLDVLKTSAKTMDTNSPSVQQLPEVTVTAPRINTPTIKQPVTQAPTTTVSGYTTQATVEQPVVEQSPTSFVTNNWLMNKKADSKYALNNKPMRMNKIPFFLSSTQSEEPSSTSTGPNWRNIGTGMQAATRLGAALFTPKPKALPMTSYNALQTTSPVFEGARRSAGSGFRTAMGTNPQAAYAQYLDATSNIAGQEADYRAQREAMNEQMRQGTEKTNIELMARNQEARDADTAARIGLVAQAIDTPVTTMARDKAELDANKKAIYRVAATITNDAAREDFLKNAFANMKYGGMIKRADGSYSRRGLWDNIRANRGSGKKPTREMLKQERKIKG